MRLRPEVQVPVWIREGKQQGLAVQGEMTLAKQFTRAACETGSKVNVNECDPFHDEGVNNFAQWVRQTQGELG